MTRKVCVFVDGENFRYSIINLFENFGQEDYLPKQADWGKFFDWLVNQAIEDAERIRTYWYVIQSQDFFPYRFPDAKKESNILKKLLCRDKTIKEELSTIKGDGVIRRMEEITKDLYSRQNKQRRRFEGWRKLQDGISFKHPRIEFRRAGAITYNLFNKELGKEKAVDVNLATDLIMLRDIYDVAVIVSGDQDYVPAVQVVKDSGKHVVNVTFKTRSGKLLPGGARRLNQLVDWSLEIKYADLAQYLNVPTIDKALLK